LLGYFQTPQIFHNFVFQFSALLKAIAQFLLALCDSFESDQKYFEQIPGFMDKLNKAAAEPIGSGQIYNPF
jgi:hypothetical protein